MEIFLMCNRLDPKTMTAGFAPVHPPADEEADGQHNRDWGGPAPSGELTMTFAARDYFENYKLGGVYVFTTDVVSEPHAEPVAVEAEDGEAVAKAEEAADGLRANSHLPSSQP